MGFAFPLEQWIQQNQAAHLKSALVMLKFLFLAARQG